MSSLFLWCWGFSHAYWTYGKKPSWRHLIVICPLLPLYNCHFCFLTDYSSNQCHSLTHGFYSPKREKMELWRWASGNIQMKLHRTGWFVCRSNREGQVESLLLSVGLLVWPKISLPWKIIEGIFKDRLINAAAQNAAKTLPLTDSTIATASATDSHSS